MAHYYPMHSLTIWKRTLNIPLRHPVHLFGYSSFLSLIFVRNLILCVNYFLFPLLPLFCF